MTVIKIQALGFESKHPTLCRFHDSPRLTLNQAFAKIAATLNPGAAVTFYKNDDGIAACIHPFADLDEPKLSYQFFPEHDSVIIRRIHAGNTPQQGLGTAMFSSQLPLWEELGARRIGVLAHHISEGFYLRLGFQRVAMLPEYDWNRQSLSLPMQLDLDSPEQRKTLDRALSQAYPLKALKT